ncbi:MAG: hypothetical protein H6721_04135 [Sandaracinus sp.]|nr:hypothetical protein [Myxococcales bacterium]MCB9600736.1 hypothetical protein [Sandaracinus sp.]MCB9624287.1 hypothetical protein [Sandaracinus sp.]MCB9631313.1 hypothetical protein [Sandaracinus sp.]
MSTKEASLCVVELDDRGEIHVADLDELSALLERVAAEHPGDDAVLVDVTAGVWVLSIGVGRACSVVSATPRSGEPPYFVLKGEGDFEATHFYSFGAWTEFEATRVVACERAMRALIAFVTAPDALPPEAWEEL